MRRMREAGFWWYVLALPVMVGAGFGIYLFLKSDIRQELVAGITGPHSTTDLSAKSHEAKTSEPENAHRDVAAESKSEVAGEAPGHENADQKVAEEKLPPIDREWRVIAGNAEGKNKDGFCTPTEYVGRGPRQAGVKGKEWNAVMAAFHEAKADYEKWLDASAKQFTPEQLAFMHKQVKALKLHRPPTLEEPDSAWRGFLVRSFDAKVGPIVRVGDGFISLAEKAPARAKFELARVLAAGWEPCQFEAAGVAQPWAKVFSCLDLKPAQDCKTPSFSEHGWAVSTVVANQIVGAKELGCQIKALESKSVQKCVDQSFAELAPPPSTAPPVEAPKAVAPVATPTSHDVTAEHVEATKDGHAPASGVEHETK